MMIRLLVGALAFLACGFWVGAATRSALAQQSDFHAIVEADGKVVLCVVKGEMLFADRCAGTGRLTIVQPVKEGPVVWRFAIGTVTIENELPNSDCALSRAKWNPSTERAVPSGKEIKLVDPVQVLSQIDQQSTGLTDLTEADITAFALDLDNDGSQEVVFVADNVQRVSELNEKTDKPYPYVIRGGILKEGSKYPDTFYSEQGEYSGGTDTIGHVSLKGIVPIAFATGEIALLFTSHGMTGDQTLVRYRRGRVQRIDAIEFMCN